MPIQLLIIININNIILFINIINIILSQINKFVLNNERILISAILLVKLLIKTWKITFKNNIVNLSILFKNNLIKLNKIKALIRIQLKS